MALFCSLTLLSGSINKKSHKLQFGRKLPSRWRDSVKSSTSESSWSLNWTWTLCHLSSLMICHVRKLWQLACIKKPLSPCSILSPKHGHTQQPNMIKMNKSFTIIYVLQTICTKIVTDRISKQLQTQKFFLGRSQKGLFFLSFLLFQQQLTSANQAWYTHLNQ